MWVKVFTAWLALTPLIQWGGRFEGPKVVWFLVGTFVLSLFWLFKGRRFIAENLTKTDYLYFGWLVILVLASLFGVHPIESIVGGSYRHQGVIFFVGLWLVFKTLPILSERQKSLLKNFMIMSLVVESLVVVVQVVAGREVINGRPLGTFGEPNATAGFLAIGSYLLYRGKSVFTLPLVFLATFLTYSKAGLAAFGVILAISLIAKYREKMSKYLIDLNQLSRRFGILVLLIFLIFTFTNLDKLFRSSSIFENRSLILKSGFEQYLKSPIIGYGAESGEVVYDGAYADHGIPLYGLMVDRSHNVFLDVAIWSGLLGLTLFLLWIVSLAKKLFSQRKWLNLGALFAWFVFATVQPLGVTHWIMLVLIINL